MILQDEETLLNKMFNPDDDTFYFSSVNPNPNHSRLSLQEMFNRAAIDNGDGTYNLRTL